jgi:hypothetical protein
MTEKHSPEEKKVIISEALDQFPDRCTIDRDRLCMRVSTSLAKAEYQLSRYNAASAEEVLEQTKVDADSVKERCAGITIDLGRTSCGLGGVQHPRFNKEIS